MSFDFLFSSATMELMIGSAYSIAAVDAPLCCSFRIIFCFLILFALSTGYDDYRGGGGGGGYGGGY